jgi:hypothetical protein
MCVEGIFVPQVLNASLQGGIMNTPLFVIRSGELEYKIYADGRIEGFPEASLVFNYVDCYLTTAIQEHERHLLRDVHHPILTLDDLAVRTA